MPLRILLRFLQNEHIIQKIAESYPVKRAAQLTVSIFHKSKDIGLDKMDKLKEGVDKGENRLSSFKDTFSKELKKEIEKLQKK